MIFINIKIKSKEFLLEQEILSLNNFKKLPEKIFWI